MALAPLPPLFIGAFSHSRNSEKNVLGLAAEEKRSKIEDGRKEKRKMPFSFFAFSSKFSCWFQLACMFEPRIGICFI